MLKLHVDFQEVGQEIQYSFSEQLTAEKHIYHEWRRPVKQVNGNKDRLTSVKEIKIPVTFLVPDNRNATDVNNFLQFKQIIDHPLYIEEGGKAGNNNIWHLVVMSPLLRDVTLHGVWDKSGGITTNEAIGEHALSWSLPFTVHNFTIDLWTRFSQLVETQENSSVRFPKAIRPGFDYGSGIYNTAAGT